MELKWSYIYLRTIGFGEDGDSVGVDCVLNESGNWIWGFYYL
jgi:hypothetical protein